MRKICLLAFSFLIFLLSFNISFAQNLSPTPVPQSAYELAYPGLLPDNPLYFTRVIRDRIVSFLIADPLRKAEFDLLQADKRLNAGIQLFNKNKISLSLSTISKAENYFEESLQKVKEAKQQGVDIMTIAKKLKNSSIKHKQVLRDLKEKSPQNFKTGFDTQMKRIANFETEAEALAPKR